VYVCHINSTYASAPPAHPCCSTLELACQHLANLAMHQDEQRIIDDSARLGACNLVDFHAPYIKTPVQQSSTPANRQFAPHGHCHRYFNACPQTGTSNSLLHASHSDGTTLSFVACMDQACPPAKSWLQVSTADNQRLTAGQFTARIADVANKCTRQVVAKQMPELLLLLNRPVHCQRTNHQGQPVTYSCHCCAPVIQLMRSHLHN